ncbi:MAG TPA: hypothetical protein VGD41_06385, partial [Pyrinomonadaceae bacterium]
MVRQGFEAAQAALHRIAIAFVDARGAPIRAAKRLYPSPRGLLVKCIDEFRSRNADVVTVQKVQVQVVRLEIVQAAIETGSDLIRMAGIEGSFANDRDIRPNPARLHPLSEQSVDETGAGPRRGVENRSAGRNVGVENRVHRGPCFQKGAPHRNRRQGLSETTVQARPHLYLRRGGTRRMVTKHRYCSEG